MDDQIPVIHIETGKKKFFSRHMVEKTGVLKQMGYKVFQTPIMPPSTIKSEKAAIIQEENEFKELPVVNNDSEANVEKESVVAPKKVAPKKKK